MKQLVNITEDTVSLEGMLEIPEGARGLVIFAHGSGSGRFSPRNNFVAGVLRQEGLGTLLMDLLTEEEDSIYENRFNINLLTDRLIAAVRWSRGFSQTQNFTIGFFGASTGAAAALQAAAILGPEEISAVVSRGGRPDLAESFLEKVQSPTLLIVGGNDEVVLELNKEAFEVLNTTKSLEVIPGATHLFEEPGALEKVADLAADWFKKYL
ncbi:dienelactone hydrolase family protein [Patescibacteria group bacterium]|nr:dienelactone hydrolase family protein [Patescibacteria group bacterium]